MARKSSSLIVFGFLFVTMSLQFFPRCLAARNLEDFSQPAGWNEDPDKNNKSKVAMAPSDPEHDDSANGDHVPTNGVVPAPPTSFHKSDHSTQRNGSQTVTNNNNGAVTNTTKTWNDKQRVIDWNGHKSETRNSSVNVTNNGNGGGQVVYSPPIIAYQPPPQGPENPQFYFPPVPSFNSP